MRYDVCDYCLPVILYGEGGDESDSDYPRIIDFIESHGPLALGESTDFGGYWECECCRQVCIGTGHTVEEID